nr:MAG TPA: hypothetical protein [Caudoviricetes sp.]
MLLRITHMPSIVMVSPLGLLAFQMVQCRSNEVDFLGSLTCSRGCT